MRQNKEKEIIHDERSSTKKAEHSHPSCWVTPIGQSDDIVIVTSPIACNPTLRMNILRNDGYLFKNIPNVGRGTINSEDEFRIRWKVDYDSFFDASGNDLHLVQDSIRSRVVICRADVLSSCNALTPDKWNPIGTTTATNIDQLDDFIDEVHFSSGSDTPYLLSNFKENRLEKKTINGQNVSYFDDILKLSVPTAGVYFTAMHTAFDLIDVTGATTGRIGSTLRVDSSIHLQSGFVIYTDPTEIRSILPVSIYVSAFVCSFVILFLVFVMSSLIRYRKSNIMKLSQVPFLYAFVFFGMINSATWMYPFYDDHHCQIIKLNVPSLCAMYAILIGRLWRINHVLSPMLPLISSKSKKVDTVRSNPLVFRIFEFISDWDASFNRFKSCGKNQLQQRNSIRRTVPGYMLVRLVCMLTVLPLVCQLYGMITFASMEEEYNENHSSARYVCFGALEIPTALSMSYLFFLQFVTVLVAYLVNGLPDQINETSHVLTASWTSITFNVSAGIVITTLSPSSSTAPDLNYLLRMFATNATVLNLTWHIIMPKIKMARSGGDSNLQHLLVERRSSSTISYDIPSICRDSKSHFARCRPSVYFSGLNNFSGNKPVPKIEAKTVRRCHSWHETERNKPSRENRLGLYAPTSRPSNCTKNYIQENIDKALDEISPNVLFDCEYDSDNSSTQKKNSTNSFVVSQESLPPSRLMSQILSTLDILWKICSQVTTEQIPPIHDWHIFKARITDLSNQCKTIRFVGDESKSEETEEILQLQLPHESPDEEAPKLKLSHAEQDVKRIGDSV